MLENTDFLLESRLKKLSPELHRRFTDCAVIMPTVLDRYANNFPTFTDHSMRHAINVIEFCNRIIGAENIERMNADECFVLLIGIYLHDMGMGVTERDFLQLFGEEEAYASDPKEIREEIRRLHHEVSGKLIRRYAELFELDSEAVTTAVIQTVRGHRVTDISDEKEYPVEFPLPDGETVCLPYLAALIRLADEIDMGKDRNTEEQYENSLAFSEAALAEFARHRAIRDVRVEPDALVIQVHGSDEMFENIVRGAEKLKRMLEECRRAVNGRTKFRITQEKVLFERI